MYFLTLDTRPHTKIRPNIHFELNVLYFIVGYTAREPKIMKFKQINVILRLSTVPHLKKKVYNIVSKVYSQHKQTDRHTYDLLA